MTDERLTELHATYKASSAGKFLVWFQLPRTRWVMWLVFVPAMLCATACAVLAHRPAIIGALGAVCVTLLILLVLMSAVTLPMDLRAMRQARRRLAEEDQARESPATREG